MAFQFMDEPRKARMRRISKSDPNRTGEARAVLRIEQGERRIDLLEFWCVCRAREASFREVLEFGRTCNKLEFAPKGRAAVTRKGEGKGRGYVFRFMSRWRLCPIGSSSRFHL